VAGANSAVSQKQTSLRGPRRAMNHVRENEGKNAMKRKKTKISRKQRELTLKAFRHKCKGMGTSRRKERNRSPRKYPRKTQTNLLSSIRLNRSRKTIGNTGDYGQILKESEGQGRTRTGQTGTRSAINRKSSARQPAKTFPLEDSAGGSSEDAVAGPLGPKKAITKPRKEGPGNEKQTSESRKEGYLKPRPEGHEPE